MKKTSLLILAVSLLGFGCGGDPKSSNVWEEDARSGASKDQEESQAEPSEEESEKAETEGETDFDGSISRLDLNKVLDAGPAAILGRVQTEPVFEKGRFVGFRIGAFNGEPPKAVDLRVGDVVVNINKKNVERPEDFYEVIEELKTATDLSFVILRENSRHTLKYPIVD